MNQKLIMCCLYKSSLILDQIAEMLETVYNLEVRVLIIGVLQPIRKVNQRAEVASELLELG